MAYPTTIEKQIFKDRQIKIYKLRRKSDGLFSSPRGWNDKGKCWSCIGHVKNHIHLLIPMKYYLTPACADYLKNRAKAQAMLEDLEIIEATFQLTDENVKTIDLNIGTALNGGPL